jgi:hypothetical protein
MVGQCIDPPPLGEVDGEEECQVSGVEHRRVYQNHLHYMIRWTGCDSWTLEPAKFVDGLLQAVEAFHQRYTQKPAPLENALRGPRT